MPEEPQDNKLVFVSDQPTAQDELGTHQKFAELLGQIILAEKDNPLVVGLFGGWGTGKSSIIDMYREKYGTKKNSNSNNIVYLDSWAYANAKE